MSLDNGWSNEYRIVDANSCVCGGMVCSECGSKIENELYIRRERTNFKHRGNETDEVYLYHKDCKTGKKFSKMWEAHEKRVKDEEAVYNKREVKRLELIAEISAWGFGENDLF